jgi:RimJ/RimL family protein N-acetyltransferase
MSIPENNPAYRIQTERLIIRCWQPTDAALLKEAVDASLDHLRSWLPWAENEPEPLPAKVQLLRSFRGKFDLGQDFVYGIFNLDESQVLGGTGLHTRLGAKALEIGYWIRADTINRGLATEAAAALTRVAFAVNQVNSVEIHCDPDNKRSAAVPRKLGYHHEATLRQRMPLSDNSYRDLMIWTLFSDDFPDSPAAAYQVKAFDVIGATLL